MLEVMRGESTSAVPFVPRMDLWYIANETRGTLPPELEGRSTAELADALGVGCHAVRADYTYPREPNALFLRGLGLDNHPDYPFRVEAPGLDVAYRSFGERHETRIATPFGDVSWTLRMTHNMAAAGVSLPFVESYPVGDIADLDRVAWVFENLLVVPTPEGYRRFHDRIGSRGVAVANGCVAASPMHLLLHELMAMDEFFYAYHDAERELRDFCARIEPFFDAMLDSVCDSPAEVVLWGANFDRDLTWPPFFQDEIAPWLRRAARRLSNAGKILLCHTDGENRGLAPMYAECGFGVAESVCPAPMTSMSLPELRRAFGPDICVWGGVPSVVLLESSYDDESFERWLHGLVEDVESSEAALSPLILGVSDNVPPDACLHRLETIGKRFA